MIYKYKFTKDPKDSEKSTLTILSLQKSEEMGEKMKGSSRDKVQNQVGASSSITSFLFSGISRYYLKYI